MPIMFRYVGKCEKFTLSRGRYKFEAWGANGGTSQTTTGYGGYTSGVIFVSDEQVYYSCVGGKGQCSSQSSSQCLGGFNGGGNGSISYIGTIGCGGGGATDVRTEIDSLNSRILVAGGSGGSSYYSEYNFIGGAGGGEQGGQGQVNGNNIIAATGGSDSPGLGGHWANHGSNCSGTDGTFGFGGNSCSVWESGSSGGGGGYYGGGGAADASGGAGGSGFLNQKFFRRILLRGDEIDNHPTDGNGLLLISTISNDCTKLMNNIHHIYLFILIILK